jgi:hypothetical protein
MTPRDLTLTALAGQAIESVTDADGRVFRTFGRSAAAGSSRRVLRRAQSYLGPVQLFLLVNVLFFFVQAARRSRA